jgi:hypothetical protein
LGLGKHLVRELNPEKDGRDTLGRWLAHHLAELMYQAENGKTSAQRSKARQQATETILKIWEHRRFLPRDAYPLAKYQDVLKVIERLKIGNDPYRFYGHNFQNTTDQITSMLFDDFTRLILTLLFRKINHLEEQKKINSTVIETLDEEEQHVWFAIQEWFTLFPNENDDDKPDKKNRKRKKSEKIDLNKNALELIDNIMNSLTELQKAVSPLTK